LSHTDSLTFLLVSGWTGAVSAGVTDLDSDDDGVLDVTPWTTVVDKVCLKRSASDTIYLSATCPQSATINAVLRSSQGYTLHGAVTTDTITSIQDGTESPGVSDVLVSPGSNILVLYGEGGNLYNIIKVDDTLIDTIAPTLNVQDHVGTYRCDSLPAVSVTALDNCDPNVTVTFTEDADVTPSCNGTITRTWTSTDSQGNTATATHVYNLLSNCRGTTSLQINEAVAVTGSNQDFVELSGFPGTSLDGYAILAISISSASKGSIGFFADLSGHSIGSNGTTFVSSSTANLLRSFPYKGFRLL
jgi:hypothetical protein